MEKDNFEFDEQNACTFIPIITILNSGTAKEIEGISFGRYCEYKYFMHLIFLTLYVLFRLKR